MGRVRVRSLPACAVMVVVFPAIATAQDGRVAGSLHDVVLPGGIRAAAAAVGDRVTPDRTQFLLEVIRRFHYVPTRGIADSRNGQLRSLVAHLETARARAVNSAATQEFVPLPLPPSVWIDAVFAGRATPDTLVGAILQSREASILYAGLLSLDDETRAWLADRTQFVRYLATGHAAAFLVAAPGLHVKAGQLQLPGAEAATAVWLDLAGRADTPEACIRAIIEQQSGRLAYFIGALAQLTPAQVSFALGLDATDTTERVQAARRVYAAFERVADRWNVEQQPFWRPTLDPALLVSELRVDQTGRPLVPGSRAFWDRVFAEPSNDKGHQDRTDRKRGREPFDFSWLCDRVFAGATIEQRQRFNLVLFASRNVPLEADQHDDSAVEAVRAAGEYPALVGTLERAGLADVPTFAAAARRAEALRKIKNREPALRAFSQYQGALALAARSAVRRHLPPAEVARLIASLASLEVSAKGNYEGRLVRWLEAQVGVADGDVPLERRLIRWVSASAIAGTSVVEWEGTRYRVDPEFAEEARLSRLLGDEPTPFLTTARALVQVAGTFGRQPPRAQLRASAEALSRAAGTITGALSKDDASRFEEVNKSLQRAATAADARAAARAVPKVLDLADRLAARGVVELTYAIAFGQPGVTTISVAEAAARHDFGPSSRDFITAWHLPEAGAWTDREWHVTGSLLGLDVRLASFSLVRITSRPPAQRPTLNDADRRVFVEAVGLSQPVASEERLADLIGALRRGRARVAAVRSFSDVPPVANAIHLSPARRGLLEWAVTREPQRVPMFLSLTELVWLGTDSPVANGEFDPWGAPGEPRVGCLCLRLVDRRPWEIFTGRWRTGIFASGFPDLNLRLAELLTELHMPAALLPSLLAPATLEFVENAVSRDDDDRRGLEEYVHALRRERAEEYLALLTTDGPLVPVGEAAGDVSHSRNPK